jgi:hypothetical protein
MLTSRTKAKNRLSKQGLVVETDFFIGTQKDDNSKTVE